MTDNIPCHVKYADDLTAWRSHRDPYTAAAQLTEDISQVTAWNNKWRLIANPQKTEVLCFSKSGEFQVSVALGNAVLKQVPLKMCLGVLLDQHLSFKEQAEYAASKALKSIVKLGKLFHEGGGINAELGLKIYKSHIRPHLEYAYPAWCGITSGAMQKLDRAHRICLLRITGCLNSTSTTAMEILTNTLPIQLRLKECLCQEFVRLHRKAENHPIKRLLGSAHTRPEVLVTQTPVNLMKSAYQHMCKTLPVDRIETLPTYDKDSLRSPCIRKHIIAWRDLGNANTRTKEQALMSNRLTTEYLTSLPGNSVIGFTDGSALSNPGPCGAGAAIYIDGLASHPILCHQPISPKSTSYHGELAAVHLCVTRLLDTNTIHLPCDVHILTDCQAALSALTSPSPPSNHTALIHSIHRSVQTLESKGATVTITWITGHSGLIGNELADKEARKGAVLAKSLTASDTPVSANESKKEIHSGILAAWQRQWTNSEVARKLHAFHPNVSDSSFISTCSSKLERKLFRAKSDFTMLKEHLHRMGFSTSPLCGCGNDVESVEHVFLHCPQHVAARDKLLSTIEIGYVQTATHPHLRTVSLSRLLGPNPDLTRVMRSCINNAVVGFLRELHINI